MTYPDRNYEDMWPYGRLRWDASLEDLRAELAWQKAWRKDVKALDGNTLRSRHGTENIEQLKEAIRDREKKEARRK